MSKRNIRDLARGLVDKYNDAEEQIRKASLAIKDTLLSAEEQTTFSKYKAEVDTTLSFLSVCLSASAQGKITEIENQLKDQEQAFAVPLQKAVENLADIKDDESLKLQTMKLISAYNEEIHKILLLQDLVKSIKFFANLPNRKKKQRRYLLWHIYNVEFLRGEPYEFMASLPTAEILAREYWGYIFGKVDEKLQEFSKYVEELGVEPESSNPDDDLNE